ncbi:MAG: hypothetical protein IJS58_05170 [Bacilli bacterium]|nr:hypothetical protein [Bacilli bacterium]
MLVISGDNISVTKADDFWLHLEIVMQDGELYELQEEDKIYFKLFKKPKNELNNPPVFKQTFDNNMQEVAISGEDTKFLKDNQYYYTCELQSAEYGKNTVVEGKLYFTYD